MKVMSMSEQCPRPEPTLESQPYWDSLRAHALRIQHCAACGQARHYPRPLCDRCYSDEAEWLPASGRGTVHSWTIAHHAFHPAFKSAVPYALVTVDLDEGVRMHAPFRGDPATIRLGMPVQLIYEDVLDDLTLPAFVAE
jgi:uncharacterized OB-fold protein